MKTESAFQRAVEATPDIATGFHSDLSGIEKKEDRKRITLSDASLLEGSVDIGTCTKDKYPNANRWDNALFYKGKAYYVEFHPLHLKEIGIVMKKRQWLKDWLRDEAPALNALKRSVPPFFWVNTSKKNLIPINSKECRAMAQKGLLPVRGYLNLDAY
jgi:hypothetical protein